MNILWISSMRPYPLNNGGAVGIYKRLEHLSKWNNIYLFYIDDDIEPEYDLALRRFCCEVHSYKRNRKTSIKTIFKMLYLPYTVISRERHILMEDIDKCSVQNRIDIINVDFPQVIINIPRKTAESIPLVLNEHNFESDRFFQMSHAASGVKSFLYIWEGVKLRHFEKYIEDRSLVHSYTFVSTKDLSAFKQKIGVQANRTYLVPVGADEIPSHGPSKAPGHVVAFFGSMDSELNEEGIIWFVHNVFPSLEMDIPDIELYVVGRDPSEKVVSLSSKNITVTGTVESLDGYYDAADVVIIPLMHGGGVKIKFLEAVGHHKVIVTTSVGAEGTTFLPDEHILVADTAQDFIAACKIALTERKAVKTMSDRMYEHFLENYKWDKICSNYQSMLREIATDKNSEGLEK